VVLSSLLLSQYVDEFFFSSRRRHTRSKRDWSSDVCSSDLKGILPNHENMVIAVAVGIARMELTEGEWTEVAVGTGFAEIVNNRRSEERRVGKERRARWSQCH